MRKYGTQDIIARYAGDKPVLRRYAGSNLVWEPVAQDPSLLVHLKFDGNVDDAKGNTVTLYNPSDAIYVDGVNGQAIAMGNSETQSQRSYIGIASTEKLQSINSDFTIYYWIKAEPIANGRIFSNFNYIAGERGIDMQTLSDGRIYMYLNRQIPEEQTFIRSSEVVTGGALISPVDFNHFAWVRSGTTLRCYYNFAISNEITIPDINVSTQYEWLINRAGNARGKAIYDDFRIYNRALSDLEIQNLNDPLSRHIA